MFFVLVLCFAFISGLQAEIVETTNGKLRGEVRGYFTAFEGIPYAEKPIGELRLEPPKELVTRWKGVRDAITPGKKCAQYDEKEKKVVGDEDCLYLNVYVPKERSEETLPIVFFIHGGGFIKGEGVMDGPELLMRRNVILVTLNYRLGALGFLSTGDEILPGNMGMKDQVMALKWINENAEAFHGNKDKITISGWSAGGSSVQLHMMSPLSRQLFERGISHSGLVDLRWHYVGNPREIFVRSAEMLRCKEENLRKTRDCLRRAPLEDLVKLSKRFPRFLEGVTTPFGVVREKDNEKGFLLMRPRKMLEMGQIAQKPWIVSVVDEEGKILGAELLQKEDKLKILDEKWLEICPRLLRLEGRVHEERLEETCMEIRRKYLGEKPITKERLRDLIRMLTDRFYKWSIPRNLGLTQNKLPVYFYECRFKHEFGMADQLLGRKMDETRGCGHGDDLLTLFHYKNREECCPLTEREEEFSDIMTKMYEDFAHGR